MKYSLTQILRCPACQGRVSLVEVQDRDGEIESGLLQCLGCQTSYPIVNFVPRFVPADNYSSSFGFQWNRFQQIQLDSYSGTTISRDRFFRQTGWDTESLINAKVLDVGCGAGRFAEVALLCGAEVFAVDYSLAVDACWQNLAPHPRLHVIQGDIYALPFEHRHFDCIYCFGVLQHTPDVKRAFMLLPQQLRPGGRLAVDVYPAQVLNFLWPKYWLRPFTKRLPNVYLFQVVSFMVRVLLPVSILIGKIRCLGKKLRYLIPVANYQGIYPLSKQQIYEWSLLDTFDMLASAYDQPQNAETLIEWMGEAGLHNTEVFRSGVLIGRGTVPN